MARIFRDFEDAQLHGKGPLLASTLTPIPPPDDPNRLRAFYTYTNHASVRRDIRSELRRQGPSTAMLSGAEVDAWAEIYVAFWSVAGEMIAVEDGGPDSAWTKVFQAWKELTNVVIKAYSSGILLAWTLPCLYVVGRYLRLFAIQADEESSQKGQVTFNEGFQDDIVGNVGRNERLEDAARVLNRIFTLCINDRSPIEESRKWGLYYSTNLLFKTYFKLNSIGLCKNILRSLGASSADTPPLESYPKSQVVTFKYYLGVINFLEENYTEAEEHLTAAFKLCHRDMLKNRELILTYLIPCHLLNTHTLPSTTLLAPYPRLEALFSPLARCIRKGDLAGFDTALATGEDEFVKRRIYLTLERGRDIALRNLFRKVFLAGGFDEPKDDAPPIRRTRIPVIEFAAALRLGGKADSASRTDLDEVECLLANMIYKNLMKGYISRERGIVVLSKGGTAFPGTGA